MTVRLAFATLLLVGTALAAGAEDANGSADKRGAGKSTIRCILTVENATWSKATDTRVHVRLLNPSDEPVELPVFPVFTLVSQPFDVEGVDTSRGGGVWAPADLVRDAPAPVDNDGGMITPKRQIVRLAPHGEAEFILHISNLKWDHQTSSTWPSHHLFKIATHGTYALNVGMAENLLSNTVAVVLRFQ